MKQLRIAIIGQGRSGRNIHGEHMIKELEKFKIVAIVDPIEERRIRAEKEYCCDSYSDYHALFGRKDIDLVVNATPSHLHVPVTLDLLNNGFNVLCEKPLARKVEDVDKLIEASKKSGKLFAIFQEYRYAAHFKQIRKVIDSGVLGRIVQISIVESHFGRRWDWQTVQEYNGGNLQNKGPHHIDQALQLFGTDKMPEITSVLDRANTYGDADDYVKIIFKGEGRPIIDVEMSSCNAYPGFSYNIQGTLGGLMGSTTHLEWKYFIPRESPKQTLIRTPLSTPEGIPCYCGEKLKLYEARWDFPKDGDAFGTMTAEFYEMLYNAFVEEGAKLEVTPEEVRQQIAVIEECLRQNPLTPFEGAGN